MCSSRPSEFSSPHNRLYISKILLIATIIGMLCVISGSCGILLWGFIPNLIKLNNLALRINAVLCITGSMIVSVNIFYMYCKQCRSIQKKKRKKRINTFKSGVHYSDGELCPENESFITNYQLSAPSSLSMPEVFTTNGDLTRKTFVSLGSLDLEKFEVVGVVHKTSSNLDFGSVEGGEVEKNSVGGKYRYSTSSYPNILFVDKFPNILSGKALYFRGSSNTHDNKSAVYFTTNTDDIRTTTLTGVFSATQNSYSEDTCITNNQKKPYTTMSYLLPRVSIQEIKETTSNIPTSSDFATVRRTRSDRIKHAKINRSIVTPAGYSLDGPAFSKLENTNQSNKISGLENINNNEKYRLITNKTITSRHKLSIYSEMSTFDNNCTSYMTNVTPFNGQASLFNLNTNTIPTTNIPDINNNNIGSINDKAADINHTEPSIISLENQALMVSSSSPYELNGKTTVISQRQNNINMNNTQSQNHVLSCATLFAANDEENLNNNPINGDVAVNSTNTEVNGLKYLQKIYSKWSVFPVYIENEKSGVKHNSGSIDKCDTLYDNNCDENSEESSPRKLSISTISHHHTKGPLHSIINPVQSLVNRIRNRWTICRIHKKSSGRNKKNHQQMKTKTRKKTKLKSFSKEAVREFSDFSLTQDLSNISDIRLEVDNNGKRHRRQTIITNASIFSLPAIPPALWNAERPVWIMGVPLENNGDNDDDHWFKVDANKLILLRQKSELSNLTDNKNHPNITGSSSSIYAFHVRPPPRLKPITTKVSRLQCELHLNQHTRAQSVGQMLTSERSALNIT
ncbi:unnamed protein product [Schistosoma spindalis]|nr:unnamed protein product [Schistosoma spindale]